jgi:hypothetical protein
MAASHRRVTLLEMTHHEFFDANGREERTLFDDGTTVTVELGRHQCRDQSPALNVR